MVQGNLVEGLTRYDLTTGEVVPCLAESWEGSDDGAIWIFKIRRGVKFHDRSTLNAEAVKFSYQRMARLQGPGAYLLSDVVDTDNIEVIDEYTVKIPLHFAFAGFLDRSTSFLYSIISPKSTNPDQFEANKIVGDGSIYLGPVARGIQYYSARFRRLLGSQAQQHGSNHSPVLAIQ